MFSFKHFKGILPKNICEKYIDFSIILVNDQENNKSYSINKEKKLIYINLYKLSKKNKNLLKKDLIKNFENDKINFLLYNKLELLNKLYKYSNKEDDELISFFTPILSKIDLEALRVSLFIRNEFKKHRKIKDLKNELYIKYGERGKMISNICTAGYFENYLKPLYEKSSPNHIDFFKNYNFLLDSGILALFVNNEMKEEKIISEIKRRLSLAKQYGLHFIHIHGIGNNNINKIKKIISNNTFDYKKMNENIINQLNVYIVEFVI
ncbi:MAG: hypothetical protein Fur0028_04270 [Bacteroidales bacterium]|nr:hypothetical protein [Bacteroidales bacterium]